LLERRVGDMVAVDKETLVDPTYVTHAEYQLFLDGARIEGRFHQPDHWSQWRFPVDQGLTPVVGLRPSDVEAFCQFLSQRYPGRYFRPPNEGELALHGFQQGERHQPGMEEVAPEVNLDFDFLGGVEALRRVTVFPLFGELEGGTDLLFAHGQSRSPPPGHDLGVVALAVT